MAGKKSRPVVLAILKLTCPVGKGPDNSSSNKIINCDGQEVALGGQNERAAACPKDKLEFEFFRDLISLNCIVT